VSDTNVWVFAATMKHEVRPCCAAAAAIVNTSRHRGSCRDADFSLYNASKHAVEGLTKTVALEFAGYGVRVNAVAPAFIATRWSNASSELLGTHDNQRHRHIFLLALKRTVLAPRY